LATDPATADPATAVSEAPVLEATVLESPNLETPEIPIPQTYPKTINIPQIPPTRRPRPLPQDAIKIPAPPPLEISVNQSSALESPPDSAKLKPEGESRNIGQFIVFRDDLRHAYRVAVKK
jgi:hypothetical protein